MADFANQEQANAALSIAVKAWKAGDLAKALKFAEKSHRLFPTSDAKTLMTRIKAQASATSTARPTASSAPKSSTRPPPPPSPKHTPEQAAAVTRVLKAKTHYEVLNISKSASDREIKIGYKKMAISLHPDKNSAPGADEAFKKISNAFTCLSDKEKRAHYDQFGVESPEELHQQQAQQRSARYRGRGQHYGGHEVTPEELFSMFFGGMGGGMGGDPFRTARGFAAQQQRARRRRAGSPGPSVANPSSIANLLQLLPLILLLLYTTFGSLSGGDSSSSSSNQIFSLVRNPPHVVRRTSLAGVPYYVTKETSQVFRSGPTHPLRRKTERQVEDHELSILSKGCQEARREEAALRVKLQNATPNTGQYRTFDKRLERVRRDDMKACERMRALEKEIQRVRG